MSDTNTTVPDIAVDTLRERIRQLDGEIQERARLNDTAIAIRNELTEMVAMLSRKMKPRKQRVSGGCAGTSAADPTEEAAPTVLFARATGDAGDAPGIFPPGTFSPRPTVFAAPSNDAGEVAEAA